MKPIPQNTPTNPTTDLVVDDLGPLQRTQEGSGTTSHEMATARRTLNSKPLNPAEQKLAAGNRDVLADLDKQPKTAATIEPGVPKAGGRS